MFQYFVNVHKKQWDEIIDWIDKWRFIDTWRIRKKNRYEWIDTFFDEGTLEQKYEFWCWSGGKDNRDIYETSVQEVFYWV